ncbi:MAG: TonB family protein [Cyclobacteriaceae bacterium]|nr:TonB family protein [Cyclobacteriaceae bacterium]
MKTLLTLLLFVSTITSLYSQTNESDFREPTSIKEVSRQLGADTMVFYYNYNWHLVKSVCKTVFRVSRVDAALGTFTGQFVDYFSSDNKIAVEGNYSNGKKEGKFNIYFRNGYLEQSGNYVNNKKSGIWEYFYKDGTRQQILDFQENEVLIKEFWNEEGKKLVDAGNGEWFIYDSPEKFKKTSGEVLNGRKNGTWKTIVVIRNMTTNIEKYKEGKFLSGRLISMVGGSESYKDTVYCSIENTPKFLKAELFQVFRCFRNQEQTNNWELVKFDLNRPAGHLRGNQVMYEYIAVNIRYPFEARKGGYQGKVTVQVTIDINSKAKNISILKGVHPSLDDESLRIVNSIKEWTCALRDGQPYEETITIPITFTLDKAPQN